MSQGREKATHLPVNSLGVLKEPKNVIDLFDGHLPLGQVVPRFHHNAIGPTTQLALALVTSVINVPRGILLYAGAEAEGDKERQREEEKEKARVCVSVTGRKMGQEGPGPGREELPGAPHGQARDAVVECAFSFPCLAWALF